LRFLRFVCALIFAVKMDSQDLTEHVESLSAWNPSVAEVPHLREERIRRLQGSYVMAEDSLKTRHSIHQRGMSRSVGISGVRRSSPRMQTMTSTRCLPAVWRTDLGVKFAPLLPTGSMTFKALHFIARYLREVLFAEWYDSGQGMPHFDSSGLRSGGIFPL